MLKFVNTDIVFQEIPDEVTLAINLSNCPCHCPGCHSSYLAGDIGEELTTDALDALIAGTDGRITCVSFMGGDAEPEYVNLLARHVHTTHPQIKAAWYSGRIRVPSVVDKRDFDYIKIGPYLRHLGPLKSKTTNQRMYRQNADGSFEDITNRFWD